MPITERVYSAMSTGPTISCSTQHAVKTGQRREQSLPQEEACREGACQAAQTSQAEGACPGAEALLGTAVGDLHACPRIMNRSRCDDHLLEVHSGTRVLGRATLHLHRDDAMASGCQNKHPHLNLRNCVQRCKGGLAA